MKNKWFLIFIICCTCQVFAQDKKTDTVEETVDIKVKDTVISKEPYNPLAPSKAAFYSAVVPGLGQVYNKKYWKIPIIYAGIGTGIYFYIDNNNEYNRIRDIYKRRLAGFTDDEFFGDGDIPTISNDRLIDAQRTLQKNKDYSIVTIIVFYALNIIDANVDAHLRQYDISDDLSLRPTINTQTLNNLPNYGLSFTFNVK